MRFLDDNCLLCCLEYNDTIDLVRVEYTCKRWKNLIRNTDNTAVNFIWRGRYMRICENIPRDIEKLAQIDWRGKNADVYPLLKQKEDETVQITDIFMDKLRLSCRSGHTITIIDDDILILFGGASHLFLFINTCDILSFKQNKILAINKSPINPPSPRWLHTSSTLSGMTVIFGGQTDNALENDVHLLDLVRTDSGVVNVSFTLLTSTGAVPSQRGGHSMVADNDRSRLILFGGMSAGQSCLNDILTLSLESSVDPLSGLAVIRAMWSQFVTYGVPPSPRWCHSCTVVGDNMLVFGGWRYATQPGARHEFSNDLYIFSLSSNTWTQLETGGLPPRPRCQAPIWHLPSLHCRRGRESSLTGYLVVYGGACHLEQGVIILAPQPLSPI
jgi:hypothetical protein